MISLIEQDKELSKIKFDNEKKRAQQEKLYNKIINENYVKSKIEGANKKTSYITSELNFPHTAIGSFAKAFKDYIHYDVYSQFNGLIFGSYNKSIQSYLQQLRFNENSNQPIDFGLPIFNYTIEIEGPDEKVDSPFRNISWFPILAKSLYESFYEDDEISMKVVYRRMKGTISANIYCSSHAEAIDIQMAFLNGFRGLNKFNQTSIHSMTILPDQIFMIDYKGRRFSKALINNKITKSFIPDINAVKFYIYNHVPAIINMSSINFSNNYYGAQSFPEYTLQASFNYELEVPNYLLCNVKSDIRKIELNIDIAYKRDDNKVINAIKDITGRELLDDDLDKNKIEYNGYNTFENGSFIDKKIININDETIMKVPCYSLFKTNQWHFKNEDIFIFIIYSGGCIRLPIDNEIAEFDDNGDILMKKDLFNNEDLIEIYVFKFNDYYMQNIYYKNIARNNN